MNNFSCILKYTAKNNNLLTYVLVQKNKRFSLSPTVLHFNSPDKEL